MAYKQHKFQWMMMLARRHGIAAPPVVDPEGKLLGCVPPHAVIEIAGRMHAEDMSRPAGILHQEEPAHLALEGDAAFDAS